MFCRSVCTFDLDIDSILASACFRTETNQRGANLLELSFDQKRTSDVFEERDVSALYKRIISLDLMGSVRLTTDHYRH